MNRYYVLSYLLLLWIIVLQSLANNKLKQEIVDMEYKLQYIREQTNFILRGCNE